MDSSWMPTSSSALVFRPHHQPKTFANKSLAYVVDPSASRFAGLTFFESVSAEGSTLKPLFTQQLRQASDDGASALAKVFWCDIC